MYVYHSTKYETPQYEYIAVRNIFTAYIFLCMLTIIHNMGPHIMNI